MISPDSALVICAAVCLFVIGIYALAENGADQAAELRALTARDLTYAEAMAVLDAPPDYPPGVLSGLWGTDPNADAWWWRCSLCREFDHGLSPVAAALEASTHECLPGALEATRAEARAAHPAYLTWENVDRSAGDE